MTSSLAGLASDSPTPNAAPALPVPPPPERASLPDDDLVAVLDPDRAPGNTAALIELFEEQLTLRAREEQLLDEWEQEVRRQVGDSADAIVASVRSAYTGVIDIVAVPAAPAAPSAADSAPAASPVGESAPAASPAADSAPTAPGTVASAVDPATLTGDDLTDLLADAPPPAPAQRTVATPPEYLDLDQPVPPPLVEPTPLAPVPDPTAVASWDALLASSSVDAVSDTEAEASAPSSEGEPEPARVPVSTAPDRAPDVVTVDPGKDPAHDAPATASAPADVPARGPRAFAIEQSALEPTPEALRAGRAVRTFWLWFAVSASALTIGIGALLVADGASLRQAILAALLGVALSGFLLGVVTRTGRWSGQPTIVVGRATFGTVGNALPAALAVLVRVLWAAAALVLSGLGVADVLVASNLDGGLDRSVLAALVAGGGLVLAFGCALLGFGAIATVGAVVAPVAGVLAVGVVAFTADRVDLEGALSIPDGSWALLVQGGVLVLSVVGLAWVSSGGDLVRYQARSSSGSAAALWTALGIALPALALISWGALLAASGTGLAESLVASPVAALASLVPAWFTVPLMAAIALSLVAAAALSLYSGGFAVLTLGPAGPRWAGVVVSAIVAAALLAGLLVAGGGLDGVLRDALVVLAVPVAAWAGIVGTETLLRRRRVHAASLLSRAGVYPAARWGPLAGLVLATAVGWGLVDGGSALAGWTGYLFSAFPALSSDWLTSDVGVVIALVLGAITALATLPALRRLHEAEERATA